MGRVFLFLSDENLRKGVEAMFFAYRGFTADPDRILIEHGYGRAHHRAMHFIDGSPGMNVTNLLGILGVTKQSLNRVLRILISDGIVESQIGTKDKRERLLKLTASGKALLADISQSQEKRMKMAFEQAGEDAVEGFQKVLEAMMDPDQALHYQKLKKDPNDE